MKRFIVFLVAMCIFSVFTVNVLAAGCCAKKQDAADTSCTEKKMETSCPAAKMNCAKQSTCKKKCPAGEYCPAPCKGKCWALGTQCWTFNRFTFMETLEKAQTIGLDCIEIFHNQPLSEKYPDIKVGHDMSKEHRILLKHIVADAGLYLSSYGVIWKDSTAEEDWKPIFEFAKDMGIGIVALEAPLDAFDTIEKLADEYKINVAIHNHPKPSIFWNPETVLKVCEGRSKRIGACADTGHWARSGVKPVEAIKMLEGRIHSLHLKDLNEFGVKEAHDVVWGTGVCDIEGVLKELKRQNFSGPFLVEYEHNWLKSLPEIWSSAMFFRETVHEIGVCKWEYLLDDELSKWNFKPGSWKIENGMLVLVGGDSIWSKEEYGDFILDLEYKCSPGANSGVFLRCSDLSDWVHTTIEVQIHDTTDGTRAGMCGAIYDVLKPSTAAQKPAGQWNHYTITCKDNKIEVVLNDKQIIDMDLNEWTQAGKNPDGTENKFKYAYKDMARKGLIGLQDHGNPIAFRNVRMMRLD